MMESELFKQFFAAQLCGMKEEMSMLREMQSDNQRELHVIQQQQQVIHQQPTAADPRGPAEDPRPPHPAQGQPGPA